MLLSDYLSQVFVLHKELKFFLSIKKSEKIQETISKNLDLLVELLTKIIGLNFFCESKEKIKERCLKI